MKKFRIALLASAFAVVLFSCEKKEIQLNTSADDVQSVEKKASNYADIVAIKKSETGTNSTEVHILDGASKYRKFKLQVGTALHETGRNFDFCYADYNRDGVKDLIAIKKYGTGTKSTEVHVLDGASKFKKFILQTGTPLHETKSNFDFLTGDYNNDGYVDIYVIKKNQTGTKSTEVHVLSGKHKYQKYILQTGTGLHETEENFKFCIGRYDKDGRDDLFAIKKFHTGTKSTEVHVLAGSSTFRDFILHTGTPLHETKANFDFLLDRSSRLYAIKKNGTGTNSTEVHVLSHRYQKFVLQTGTALHETGGNFQFCIDR